MSQGVRHGRESSSDTRLDLTSPQDHSTSTSQLGSNISTTSTPDRNDSTANFSSPFPSPLTVNNPRSRKPTPSPLHNSFASSPLTSPGPTQTEFEQKTHDLSPTQARGDSCISPQQATSTHATPRRIMGRDPSGTSPLDVKFPGPATPANKTPSPVAVTSKSLPIHDQRSVSDTAVTMQRQRGLQASGVADSVSSRTKASLGATRTASIDSTFSSKSTSSTLPKLSQDGTSSPADMEKLIAAAGSPEAVIQHLLKDKQSQAQQNSQLWRLVDKQRAMILGLNKDLERALRDKDRYRKKLKEVLGQPLETVLQQASSSTTAAPDDPALRTVAVPASPSLDFGSQKHSPITVGLAPYPITPPADQQSNGPPSAISEVLDPSRVMPRAAEHALDNYDHEKQETRRDVARKQADDLQDLKYDASLRPSKTRTEQVLPKNEPTVPPPSHSSVDQESSMPDLANDDLARFPPPPLPPPRKPPPAPLQLRNPKQTVSAIVPDEREDSESDYDDVLELDKSLEARGRRRTRADDDHKREIIARHEAEARSQSKKSLKKSGSGQNTPQKATTPATSESLVIPPQLFSRAKGTSTSPASLAPTAVDDFVAPMLSPGLPSNPRPMALGLKSSPPLSPRFGPAAHAPLSPRPPRQAIPLPPNTPLQTPPLSDETPNSNTPAPLKLAKKQSADSAQPPTRPEAQRQDSATDRKAIFRGLVTDEYPDFLLPPNALPSVRVSVASSRMKPSRASLLSLTQLEEDPVFTLAVISRSDGGELWRVEKDSGSLAKLDSKLKQCAAVTARTPDRSLFSGHAPAKLDARRQALNLYLEEIMETPLDLAAAQELCRYLSNNTLPPNADETGFTGGHTNETEQKTGPGGRPFKTGYLTKKGKNFGGWKARFFVLDGPHLKYYETPGGAHLGTIKLQNAQIGKQQHQHDMSPAGPGHEDLDDQYRHAFLVMEPKKRDPSTFTKHYFCAESDGERDQWVDSLLRWIDYREAGEEDNKNGKSGAQDRKVNDNERSAGINAKKKMYGQGKLTTQYDQPTTTQSAENLIGVSYETTKQGEIPHGAPTRKKSFGAHDSDSASTLSSQPALTISAPRDPQVISTSESWAGKSAMAMAMNNEALGAPGPEEKKARKRSFFGFGPKPRSSSDGADSLYGDSIRGSGSGPSMSAYNGPVRQIFGAPLAEAVRYNSPRDVRVALPCVVYRCIQYLDAKEAIIEEGIFRMSGSNVAIKQLRERFNTEGDINLVEDGQYHDIHAIASLLKLYLRELPATILTRDLHLDFLAVSEMANQADKYAVLSTLVERLPQANGTLLRYLIAFLIKIISHSDRNKMTIRNVGIVFSPTLNIPAPVFAMFLQNYEAIFGVDPEQYELPSPIGTEDRMSERRPSVDMVAGPRRPSTGARESPHRQRLVDALQEGRHGHTPPPVSGINPLGGFSQMRTSQTPPGGPRLHNQHHHQQVQQQQSHYDLQQQNTMQQAGSNNAAAYESGSYDNRPIYETAYDQPHATRANRRESAVSMQGHGNSMLRM